jgi:hypothetical protein
MSINAIEATTMLVALALIVFAVETGLFDAILR